MNWKCPDCGAENPDSKMECACGYAYYKVMGIKAGESAEFVSRTYKYLMTVWQDDKFAHDPVALKNTRERNKKINEAYEIFRGHFSTAPVVGEKRTSRTKIISLAALVIMVIAGVIIYLTASQESAPVKQTAAQEQQGAPSVGSQADSQEKPEGTTSSENSPGQQATLSDQRSGLSDNLPDNPGERAIALVKRSHVIDKIMDVDTLMKKWADENSAGFHVVGWKATKMDEPFYLVVFSISNGPETKSFYFDADTGTGVVRHLADHPDLQKKYGIQYKQ